MIKRLLMGLLPALAAASLHAQLADRPRNSIDLMRLQNIARQNVERKGRELDYNTATSADLPNCAGEVQALLRPSEAQFVASMIKTCESDVSDSMANFRGYLRQAQLERERNARQQNSADSERSAEVTARAVRAQELEDLKLGRRRAIDCNEFVVEKGLGDEPVEPNPMAVAHTPPKGIGIVIGQITQMDGDLYYLRGVPDARGRIQGANYAIVTVGRDVKVFRPTEVRVDGVVRGFARQVGTRKVRLANGEATTVAVLHPICIEPQ